MVCLRSGRAGGRSLSLDITHTYRGDLVVELVSPSGTVHMVHNRTGGSADNLVIEDLVISVFDGQGARGNWQLRGKDRASQDVGTLRAWSLTFGADGGGC